MTKTEMRGVLSRSKVYAHPERLQQWLATGKTKPITLEIDPTNQCSNNCGRCAGNRSSPDARLEFQKMKGVIDQVSGFVKGIVFTGGGEPLLNPDTANAIIYAKEQGIDVGLVTNGLALDARSTENLVKCCSWIRISLDATDAKTYAQRKGADEERYGLAWQNIRRLVAQKNALGPGCMLGIAYLTENEDFETLETFSKQIKQAGADYAQFRPYHHSNNNLMPVIDRTRYLETSTFKIIYPADKYERTRFDYERAFGDDFRFVIAATGEVYPDCYTRGMPGFSYGNIHEQSFEEIWSSKRREGLIRAKLQQKNCPEQCYQDPLNQLLWAMHLSRKEAMHINFI